MKHLDLVPRYLREPGVEIGAFVHPVPGIKPIYVDRFREFGGQRCLADYHGDACSLPFHDDSLNYVVCSHVLEHVANPVAALREWYRVVRPGGIVYFVVPDRRVTWDRRRPLTPVAHFLEDHARGTRDSDPTHLEEFIENLIWEEFWPHLDPVALAAAREDFAARHRHAVAHGLDINIHFHTFEPSNVRGLIETLATHPTAPCRWSLLEFADSFPDDAPNGILAVLRIDKSPRERAAAWWHRLTQPRRSPTYPVLPNAQKFAD